MNKEPTQKTAYCTCGEQVTMRGKNLDDAIAMWRSWGGHRGEGHAPCDRKTAMQARKERGKRELMKPKRIQRKRTKGWRLPPSAVIVTRPTKWGNPFQIGGKLGDTPWKVVRVAGLADQSVDTVISRGMALRLYRVWLREKLEIDPFFLNPLMGKDLACWCSGVEPCHADILLEFANGEVSR